MKIFICLIFIGILSSCSITSTDSDNSNTNLQYTYLDQEQRTNPIIEGIWKSIGNGYYLEARADSIFLYSYTKSHCYKEKNDYLEGLLNTQSQFILRGDTIGIYLTDYGTKTKTLQTKKDFLRIENLPEHCMTFSEMIQLSAKSKFFLYQETMKENYAFARERNLNWENIFEAYHDSVLSTDTDLFQSMGEIAILTKDHHTKVIAEDGTSRQYRITPSALTVQNAFQKQKDVKDLNDYFNLFFNNNKKNISESLLRNKGQKVLNENIEWGRINDKVGYIGISSFAGFLTKEYTRKQQIDSIQMQMNKIIDSLKSVDAIIVDVSFNFGGYDASALTIAGYFTEEPTYAFSSQVFNNGNFFVEDEVVVYPSEIHFSKPVYLLMTDISRSAAEGFAMMMDALPNTKLVGINTLGTLSGMLGKSIGPFYTTYSNQRLVNSNGTYFEVTGVKPDLEIAVFPEDNVMNGHLDVINRIVKIITEKSH